MIEEGSKFWYGLKSEVYVQYSQRPLKMTRGCLILNCFGWWKNVKSMERVLPNQEGWFTLSDRVF